MSHLLPPVLAKQQGTPMVATSPAGYGGILLPADLNHKVTPELSPTLSSLSPISKSDPLPKRNSSEFKSFNLSSPAKEEK